MGLRERKSRAERGKSLRFCNPKGIVPFGPGLRGTSYPGLLPRGFSIPTGLCQICAIEAQPRWGCLPFAEISQGSSFLPPSRRAIAPLRRDGGATLGSGTESRWDSRTERDSASRSRFASTEMVGCFRGNIACGSAAGRGHVERRKSKDPKVPIGRPKVAHGFNRGLGLENG